MNNYKQSEIKNLALQYRLDVVDEKPGRLLIKHGDVVCEIKNEGTFFISIPAQPELIAHFGQIPNNWLKVNSSRFILSNEDEGAGPQPSPEQLLRVVANLGIALETEADSDKKGVAQALQVMHLPHNSQTDAQDQKNAKLLQELLQNFSSIKLAGNRYDVARCLHLTGLQVWELKPEYYPIAIKCVRAWVNMHNIILVIPDAIFDPQEFRRLHFVLDEINMAMSAQARYVLYEHTHGMDTSTSLPRMVIKPTPVDELQKDISHQFKLLCTHIQKGQARGLMRRLANTSVNEDQSFRLKVSTVNKPQLRVIDKKRANEAWHIFQDLTVGHRPIVERLFSAVLTWMKYEHPRVLVICLYGPTGSGKNYLAESLAMCLKVLFDLDQPLYTSIDANTIISGESLWTLYRPPCGIVGNNRPGLLERASGDGSVLTVDEVDKAPAQQELVGFLTQLTDSGGFRNGQGDFCSLGKQVLIITMNAGSNASDEKTSAIGFMQPGTEALVAERYASAYQKLLHPALRGRVHHAIYLPRYNQTELQSICQRMLSQYEFGKNTNTESIAAQLCQRVSIELGIRGLQREIEAYVLEQQYCDFFNHERALP